MSQSERQSGNPNALAADSEGILRAMRGIVRSITIHSKRLFRDTGLTLPQVLCLRAIDAAAQMNERVTSAEIARSVQLSAATVTGIMDRLERGELIVRARDTVDRRRVYLNLTPKGQEWLGSLPSNLQDRVVERLNRLPTERRQSILAALNDLLQLMEAPDLESAPILAPGEDASNLLNSE